MALPPAGVRNIARFLPGLLTLDRKPMSLANHFPLSLLYSTVTPAEVVLQAGRGVGKTQQTAGRLVCDSALNPGFKALVVTPLQEQSDRLSALIFKPMIEDSPVRVLLRSDASTGSMRRKEFDNRSVIHFSYAFLDTDRVRGLHVRVLYLDELQDLDPGHLPVLNECVGSHPQPVVWKSGTSKTKDTALFQSYQASSQGVWRIRCPRMQCARVNDCIVEDGHLLDMIGPFRDDISEAHPGLVCSGCRKPVNPRDGGWHHRYPERLPFSVGLHVPQPIVPIHYAHPIKWAQLVNKMNGQGQYTTGKFYNEVLGEPYDSAFKLVSVDDLKAAGRGVGPNTRMAAAVRATRYHSVVLGVDWGGGGESGVSRTKVAAVGLAADGVAEVFFGDQLPPTTDRKWEAEQVLERARLVRAHVIAHDYGGVGSATEAILTHLGWPLSHLAPMSYQANMSGDMVGRASPSGARQRGFYVMDKARTLQHLAVAVRAGKVRFFDYDFVDADRPGLLHDFLTLVENWVEGPSRNVFSVRKRNPGDSDDFAHSVNFCTAALWELTGSWPDLTRAGWVSGAHV